VVADGDRVGDLVAFAEQSCHVLKFLATNAPPSTTLTMDASQMASAL
jgi:hypothetical protein